MSDDERSTPASDVVMVNADDLTDTDDERFSKTSNSRKSSVSSLQAAAGDAGILFDEPPTEEEDPLFKDKLVPLDNTVPEAVYDAIYTEDTRSRAVVYLIFFSALLIVIPGISMYVSYYYIFQGVYHYDQSTAMLYSGVVAIFEVYFIVAAFIYLAYCDEQRLEKIVDGITEKDKDQ